MQIQHEVPQMEEVRAHIHKHREAYLFGVGIVAGICGARLLGQQQVIVHVVQGTTNA